MDKTLLLNPSDYVGVSFWLISAAMVAATFFFWVERDRAVGKWKTSLTVAAMVTGIAAIQIGRIMGAKVIAAASSIEKQNYTKSLGADITIGYENIKDQLKELTNNKGVDVIFDPVGGELFEESSRALSRYGKILVIGFASGKIPKFPINLALVKEFDIVGVFWGAFTRNNTDAFKENMNELFNWFKDGKINPQIEDKFKLQDASKALDKILNRGTRVKVILYP